jgi:hypothetical protein
MLPELNFDLKGVKVWLNLYFNADGTISNLAFYPKPNSRNVPEEELIAFFKNFCQSIQASCCCRESLSAQHQCILSYFLPEG